MDGTLSLSWRIFWRALITLALYTIFSSGFYMAADGSILYQLFALFLALAIPYLPYCSALRLVGVPEHERQTNRLAFLFGRWSCTSLLALLGTITLDVILLHELAERATAESIISPWQLVSVRFFLVFAASTALLLIATHIRSRLRIAAVVLHTFVFLGVASVVYTLGFGFDGFIHRATEHIILDHGVAIPKTPYYIGQYMVNTFLTHVFGWSIDRVDRFVIPLLAAFILPLGIYWLMRRAQVRLPLQRTMLLFLFPLPLFISTTPQSLALLFLWLAVAITAENTRRTRIVAAVFALASTAVHPLAGIPGLVYVLFLIVHSLIGIWHRRVALTIASILGAGMLPLALSWQTHTFPAISALGNPFRGLITHLPPDTPALYQSVYSYAHLFLPLLFIAVVASTLLKKPFRAPLALAALVCLVDAWILASMHFPLVIAYEQGSFSGRLVFMAGMFLAPYFFLGVARQSDATTVRQDRIMRCMGFVLFVLASTTAFYLCYPRADRVELSKGYSTSLHDFEAVSLIRNDAGTDSYLVLANQAVSAAAAHDLLFSPSVALDGQQQFIYPIPTGGALYPYYLRMVYDGPSDAVAQELKEKTGVQRVYFVLNTYWTNARDIRAAAELSAGTGTSVADKVWIYRY